MKKIKVAETDKKVAIENEFVKYEFDLKTGLFSGTDKKSVIKVIDNAVFAVDKFGKQDWFEPEKEISWEKKDIKDDFGIGKKLTLRFVPGNDYAPISMLSISLYEDKTFALFNWGIENHRSFPMRTAHVEIIRKGDFLKDIEFENPQVLRGGAGAEPNFVEDTFEIETINSAMLTFKNNGKRHSIVTGGLKYKEFVKSVEFLEKNGPKITLTIWDPQGKLVELGETYFSEDSFYLDISTSNPFEALEKYGMAMRTANSADPNTYDFPTLCGWMVSTKHLGEGKPINNSAGLVEQTDIAREKGFMKYSPFAVRLEPDYYCYNKDGNTQQGWWDDEHWAKYGALVEPYETFEKWCSAVKERGGIPFTYFQTSMPSNDFALAHPEWMLNKDISQLHSQHAHQMPKVRYDYTNPGFQEHALNVWKRLGEGGLQGIKFDYPETGWASEGGFEEKSYTTTSAYRKIYELCREGLGEDAFIHERILGGRAHENVPRTDVCMGVVDQQRVWGDSSHFEPEMASRMGLRWYKNRVVFIYYPDGKSLYEKGSDKPLDKHKRRTFLTLIALLSGRLEIGTSIGRMTDEMFHDVTRLYPMISEPKSPRPVDMLIGKKHPEIYVYDVTDKWKQIVLLNNDTENQKRVSAPLSGNQVETGSIGFDESKDYYIFDFWNQKFIGLVKGKDEISADLKPEESVVYSIREKLDVPQVISTNRHIMQGMMELNDVSWNEVNSKISGKANVIGDEEFVITIATNGKSVDSFTSDCQSCEVRKRDDGEDLIDLLLRNSQNLQSDFEISLI
jgi:hypothetical protein